MKKNYDNVVLIGMPGVGKSTVGVVLAKILGYDFIDSDLLIQDREGKLLHEIISDSGIEKFLQIEDDVNASIQEHHSVIATGGSVVYGSRAMEHLGEIGVIVYIRQDLKSLKRRLRNIRGRGVVLKPGQTLEDLYMERTALYEKYADITVDEYGLNVEETIQAVRKALNAYSNDSVGSK